MNIIEIDYEKKIVKSDFFTWKIISNNNNKFLLLQREDSGVYHAAEADVKMKQLWEVKESAYRGPDGRTYFFDEETGVTKL